MRMRNGAMAIACGVAAMFGCSLFVSLDDLQSGSSDASTDAPIANDAISPSDSSIEGSSTDGQVVSLYPAAVLADKPLAYFRLDETSGATLADSSGNGHDAMSTTVLLGGSGAFAGSGSSAHFDGSAFAFLPDSVSDAGTVFDFLGHAPFSLEAWVKIDVEPDNATGQEFTFLSKEKNIGSDNFIGFDFLDRPLVILQRENDPTDDTQAMTAAAGIPDTTAWHYLVGSYDGSTIEIYVDNVLAATKTGSTTTIPVTPAPVLIGAEDMSGGGNGLVGSMDEVAIYSSALTLTQRTTHFNAAGH
jgi:concanavalin A-like lectin/glucanase superfamily protein